MRLASSTGRLYELRRGLAIAGSLLAITALGAAFAVPAGAAKGGEKPSRVTVRYDGSEGQFRGHVTASKRCTASRTIVIYRRGLGRDQRVGKGKTGSEGRYRINPNQLIPSDHYAVVRPGGNNSGASCDKAVSKQFKLGF